MFWFEIWKSHRIKIHVVVQGLYLPLRLLFSVQLCLLQPSCPAAAHRKPSSPGVTGWPPPSGSGCSIGRLDGGGVKGHKEVDLSHPSMPQNSIFVQRTGDCTWIVGLCGTVQQTDVNAAEMDDVVQSCYHHSPDCDYQPDQGVDQEEQVRQEKQTLSANHHKIFRFLRQAMSRSWFIDLYVGEFSI